jgi:environmental stress-induced protein Ves
MTVAVQVLRAHERPVTPWMNGGGVTREIAVAPLHAGLTEFAWRISLADVTQGGPFSGFVGVDRIITVVDGPGMVLTVDGTSHTLAEPYEPFTFPGDAATDCRLLGGPIIDFNVMARRGEATAKVEIVREQVALSAPAGGTVLAIALQGSAVLETSGLTLDRFDAALITKCTSEALGVDGTAAIVTLTNRPTTHRVPPVR